MSLLLGKKDQRTIKVSVDEPMDGIQNKKHTFDVTYKILKKEEVEAIRRAYRSEDDASGDAAILDSIVNIDGIKDESGNAIAYNKDALGADLIETSWAWRGVTEAFYIVQGGVTQQDYAKAKLKN